MKKLFLAFVVIAIVSSSVQAKYSGGSGTANDPYRIGDANDLLALAADTNDYDANFILIADIDLAGYDFNSAVIAPGDYHSPAFTGSFDGDGNKITNLTIYTNDGNGYLGLFGRAYFSEIKNLGVENFSITSDNGIGTSGGLVGWNGNGSINNCNSTGIITCGNDSGALGGLVGNNSGGTITDSNSTANVTCGNSSHGLGGLVGGNDGTISHCFATGNVSGYNSEWELDVGDLGGLVGNNFQGSITDSYATGNVTAGYCFIENMGGLAGSNFGGTISCCFSTGTVTCLGNLNNGLQIGGLVGENEYYEGAGTIINCFATGNANSSEHSNWVGGLVGTNGQWCVINNSYSTGDANGNFSVGGLVGGNGGDINQCYSKGTSSGNSDIGGLAGRNNSGGNIFNCYSTSNVNGTDFASKLGGLVGENGTYDYYYGTILNCYATGNVNGGPGSSELGGLVGYNNVSSNITNCYSIGIVIGEIDLGGLVGGNSGTVTASFWDRDTSGLTDSNGGTGKTTAEMKTESTFTDAGWDFVGETANGTDDIWWILEHITYPKLNWQRKLPPGGNDGGIYFPDYNFDNFIDFFDFAIFADAWLTENPFISLDGDNYVDIDDLKIFCDHWLTYTNNIGY